MGEPFAKPITFGRLSSDGFRRGSSHATKDRAGPPALRRRVARSDSPIAEEAPAQPIGWMSLNGNNGLSSTASPSYRLTRGSSDEIIGEESGGGRISAQ
jgi:hypothetical protein